MPVAIITGSDSGIGKAAAVRLAEDGFLAGEESGYSPDRASSPTVG